MKGTESFKKAIEKYLENRAANDELFAVSFKKEGKSIDDCITYILNEVKSSGCNGFEDDEIYSMAVHYYDEDKIKVGKPISSGSVVVNHVVELTEVEKQKAKNEAYQKLVDENAKKLTASKPKKDKKVADEATNAPSLFDF